MLVAVDEYIAGFERKVSFWTELKTRLTDAEAKRLGLREEDE